ncbi:MAG: GNAT family N-acetyltransferase [Gammaproteobacteria bacterium]|nr:MAG: GNAT family N-acetyltransferase [Gammaproteobacteria bacterium]
MTELETPRLKLRQWRAADLEPFASLNADPVVIEFLSRCLTRAESDEFAERVRSELAQRGWGLWAVEVLSREAQGPAAESDLRPGDLIVAVARHPLQRHVLYRLRREDWQRAGASPAIAGC